MSWEEYCSNNEWSSSRTTELILGRDSSLEDSPLPNDLICQSAKRISGLRQRLKESWVGLELENGTHLIDWLLATLIARENALLIGTPGVAKTEISEKIYEFLGLHMPQVGETLPELADKDNLQEWWHKQVKVQSQSQKYFHYLLSRFTQPEELFGPIEIDLLRRGMLVRMNFGLMTAPGVRAVFLDEVFKASSSILNTLLTLINEREYFNWGGMVQSDMLMLIAASNELPGGLGSGQMGLGAGGEDFSTLYAFLDRFAVRLPVPAASGSSHPDQPEYSNLRRASENAIARESLRFSVNRGFQRYNWVHGQPCLNDMLVLGRVMLEDKKKPMKMPGARLFERSKLEKFNNAFYQIATDLQVSGTSVAHGRVSWTISPRKLKALYKVALAHALITTEDFSGKAVGPGAKDLHVFDLIWDSPGVAEELAVKVNGVNYAHYGKR